ncbi:MAG: competence/damage-inducible protein A [Candidatus Eisenbacteria bacterium]|nr:competence/damage-inducible protein A [Candidatus Eisenbacteria bacterium]
MKLEVITVGSEIVSGSVLDTNFRFIARKLTTIGARVLWHTSVGDEPETMAEALKIALKRADAIIVTGGLGPTPDDITRKVVSTVFGRALFLNDSVLETIRARFKMRGVDMPSINERQALFPKGTEIIDNKVGTAPGFLLKEDGKSLFVIPGVPLEAEAMVEQFIVPHLSGLGTLRGTEQIVLRTTGLVESVIAENILALEEPLEGVSVSYLPHEYGVDLCFTFKGADAKQVALMKRMVREKLAGILGEHCYAEGGRRLEEVVGELLASKGLKLAVAESVTGGTIAELVTSVPGASRYFTLGVTAYSNEAKVNLLGVPGSLIDVKGAVCSEVAIEMARGVRERGLADVGVSTTGIAGPSGGTAEKPVGLVFIGLVTDRKAEAREISLGGNRALIVRRASAVALDMVRRSLL